MRLWRVIRNRPRLAVSAAIGASDRNARDTEAGDTAACRATVLSVTAARFAFGATLGISHIR